MAVMQFQTSPHLICFARAKQRHPNGIGCCSCRRHKHSGATDGNSLQLATLLQNREINSLSYMERLGRKGRPASELSVHDMVAK